MRWVSALCLSVGLILGHTAAASAATCDQATKHGQAACLISNERQAVGLRRLIGTPGMHESARKEAALVARCSFSHFPCGISWTRSLPPFSCSTWRAGETLGEGFQTAAQVVAAWMASPEHRTILLDPAYKTIGVAHHYGIWVVHVGTCT